MRAKVSSHSYHIRQWESDPMPYYRKSKRCDSFMAKLSFCLVSAHQTGHNLSFVWHYANFSCCKLMEGEVNASVCVLESKADSKGQRDRWASQSKSPVWTADKNVENAHLIFFKSASLKYKLLQGQHRPVLSPNPFVTYYQASLENWHSAGVST